MTPEENTPEAGDGTVEDRVKLALDEIRPHLQNDGGDIELVEIRNNDTVVVKLKGACSGCPMSAMTLKNGVERAIKERAPEIQTVEAEGLPAL